MGRFLVTPHVYGAEVFLTFTGSSAVVVPPSARTLHTWTQAALLNPGQSVHSPFRSVECRTPTVAEQGIILHVGDFVVESSVFMKTKPGDFPLRPWLQTLTSFVRTALRGCVQQPRLCEVLTPVVIVRQLLYREWGSCSGAFLKLLEAGGVTPVVVSEIVDQVWTEFLRLPEPRVFKWVQSEEVREMILTLVRNKHELPKCLRV